MKLQAEHGLACVRDSEIGSKELKVVQGYRFVLWLLLSFFGTDKLML